MVMIRNLDVRRIFMKNFSMPSDFKKETINQYENLNNNYSDSKIVETYGQISVGTNYEAGRILTDIPRVDIEGLKKYIEYSEMKGIGFNYTINGPCMGNKEFTKEGIREFKNFLGKLYRARVRSLTVALPSLIEIVKSARYDFEIKASTLCSINNANKAAAYKMAGVSRIVPEESINREFANLKRIVNAFGDKVEIIINTLCYKDCTYRTFHYNQMAHDSVEKENQTISSFYNHMCMLKRCERLSNVLKLSWVRPEDLKYYTSIGVNYFKIQGRHTVFKGDPVRTVEAYMKESYDGNLIELLELFNPPSSFSIYVDNKKLDGYIKTFYENENFCKRDCNNCGFCDQFVKKCTDHEKASQMNGMASEFYMEYDEFLGAVNEIDCDENDCEKESSTMLNKFKKDNISFDFDSFSK